MNHRQKFLSVREVEVFVCYMHAMNEINVDDMNKQFNISLSTAVYLLDDRICLIKQQFSTQIK